MGGFNEIIVAKVPGIKSGTLKALSVFMFLNIKKKQVVKEYEK